MEWQQRKTDRGFLTRMVYLKHDYIVEIHHSGREPSIFTCILLTSIDEDHYDAKYANITDNKNLH